VLAVHPSVIRTIGNKRSEIGNEEIGKGKKEHLDLGLSALVDVLMVQLHAYAVASSQRAAQYFVPTFLVCNQKKR